MKSLWKARKCAHMLLLGVLTGLPVTATAQEGEQPGGVAMTGFVDFYFSKNLARPASHANKFRNFDVTENQFDLALAEIVFQKTASPVGFRIDADFGSANDMVQGGTQSTLNNLQQAYLSAVLPVGDGLSVDVGKCVTHMGYEVIESRDNWNYSRSLLFALAIPYYHVGIRAAYPVLSNLTVTGYLYNGWNNLRDNNDAKTVGASLIASPTDRLSLIAGWLGGNEQVDSTGVGARHVFDATVVFRPTDNLAFAVNGSYGTENQPSGSATWKGIALYARYLFSGATGIALRAEVYDDADGFSTGIPRQLREVTATLEQTLFTHLLVRAEYRHDWSSVEAFDDRHGVDLQKVQDTFAIGTVITF